MTVAYTPEQVAAIERGHGDLLLDASAGSGKTSVLVERFVRAVLHDGVDVGAILAITFTEKAAAELRERIRARLRALGADEAARETEAAPISTIHGFCARVLRANALAAGLDPAFTVLDQHEAARLALDAFDAALDRIALRPHGAELIAAHGPTTLRSSIIRTHEQLRSRGQTAPRLPPIAGAIADAGILEQELSAARGRALRAASVAASELAGIADPPARVGQALDALARAGELLAGQVSWPGELTAITLPASTAAAALASEACDAYRAELAALRTAGERLYASTQRFALDELLVEYGERYGALKAGRSAVDFEDLELLARRLLAEGEIGARLRDRFAHVMVDELQDTNRVQFELIELVSAGNLFMVGDAQQSIYGFRHAEVELFQARGAALEPSGSRLSLNTNFRSRPEILAALNGGFESALGEHFRPLRAGRLEPPAQEALVELLIVDKGADWEADGLAAPWRTAEARALAARVRELTGAGVPAGEIVVLTRASTDLRVYERALEDVGVPTYLIGGRGYWSHPQVVELVCYLRALANPQDAEALYATWCSPLCGISLDALVLLAAGARDELSCEDRERLETFERWFMPERRAAARIGAEELLHRVIERTDYELAVLALPGGRRRLANVRKLMRLGREWEAMAGSDLHGFLALIERRMHLSERESEAPVESEAIDAVRLMTIHRSKGLEFGVVCVADLGRGPVHRPDLIRVSRDGTRLGLRLARPGTAARIPALDYNQLGDQQAATESQEERRLFYVAMTRARERLILSGAAKLDTWAKGNTGTPIDWIAPALVPEIAAEPVSQVTGLGVRLTVVSASDQTSQVPPGIAGSADQQPDRAATDPGHGSRQSEPGAGQPPSGPAPPLPVGPPLPLPVGPPLPPPVGPPPPVASLSYSALAEYERCGYRFYVERVLGVAGAAETPGHDGNPGGQARAGGAERGTAVHALLERIEFRRPVLPALNDLPELDGLPADDLRAVVEMAEAFVASETCGRLTRAPEVRTEQRFALALAGGPLLTGVFDVLALEDRARALVVDYKSDRLDRRSPAAVVAASYAQQQAIYALAALRTGVQTVEVAHLFLERPDDPVTRTFDRAELGELEQSLLARTAGITRRSFPVAEEPQRAICDGCPAQDGLCSWPVAITRRLTSDRLF